MCVLCGSAVAQQAAFLYYYFQEKEKETREEFIAVGLYTKLLNEKKNKWKNV